MTVGLPLQLHPNYPFGTPIRVVSHSKCIHKADLMHVIGDYPQLLQSRTHLTHAALQVHVWSGPGQTGI